MATLNCPVKAETEKASDGVTKSTVAIVALSMYSEKQIRYVKCVKDRFQIKNKIEVNNNQDQN